jgi:hypothetical protein
VALVPQSFSVKTDRAGFVELAGNVPAWEIVTVTSDPTSSAASALLREAHPARADHSAETVSG